MRRSIDLDDAQLHELERLASRDRRTVDELLQFAVGDYLARRKDPSVWSQRLVQAVEKIREGVPTDTTSDEIESDLARAWEEHRAQRTKKR